MSRTLRQAAEIAAVRRAGAARLPTRHWPGPLTLVLPLRARRADRLAGHRRPADTIAVRAPAHPAMRALLARDGPAARRAFRQCQRPDQPDPRRPCPRQPRRPHPADRRRRADRARPRIHHRRRDRRRACACCAPARSTSASRSASGGGDRSAGPAPSHYAPAKPLRLDADGAQAGEWLIGFGAVAGDASLSPSGDLVEAAAALFDGCTKPKPRRSRGSRSRRSRTKASAPRSTTACAAPPRRGSDVR